MRKKKRAGPWASSKPPHVEMPEGGAGVMGRKGDSQGRERQKNSHTGIKERNLYVSEKQKRTFEIEKGGRGGKAVPRWRMF